MHVKDHTLKSKSERDVLWYHEEDGVAISPKDLSHPIFRPIVGFETTMLWHRHPITKHWGMQVDGDNESYPTQTIIRFSNQEPAVIERVFGVGRAITKAFRDRPLESLAIGSR